MNALTAVPLLAVWLLAVGAIWIARVRRERSATRIEAIETWLQSIAEEERW